MSFSVGIDWLQGIIIFESSEKLKEVATFLAELTQDEIAWADEHPWFCGIRWNHSVSSIRGIKISWNLTNRGIKCLLVLPGSFWGKLDGIADYWNVCRFLAELNFRCTRIDIRIDDYTKSITYEDLSDAIAKDNYSGAEVADIKRPKRRFLGYDGWTIYFGSAKSDKRVKFYDKAKESKGEIDAIRMETQYRDERANWVFSEFVECEDFAAGNFLASICVGGITFCDIASSERQDKRKLLPWWERFTQKIARGQKVPSNRPKPTADSRITWLMRVACSINTIYEGLGEYFDDFWEELIESGKERMTQTHRLFIKVCQTDIPIYRKGVYCYK